MKNKSISVFLSLLLSLCLIMTFGATAYADEEFDGDIAWEEEEWYEEPDFSVPPVTTLKVSNLKSNSATLSWKNPGGVDGYELRRYVYTTSVEGSTISIDLNVETIADITNPDTLTYQLTDLMPLEGYDMVIAAYRIVDGIKQYSSIREGSEQDILTPVCTQGSFYSSNTKAAKSIAKVIKQYKDNAKFKGKGECYGYAEWASKKIAKTRTQVKVNKKVTLANVKKYIVGLKPGAHVRCTSSRTDHSILILKSTKDRIYWADNNWGHNNRVHYHAGTPEELYFTLMRYSKISYIMKTKTFR